MEKKKNTLRSGFLKNTFSLGSQVGGMDAAVATGGQEQQLRDAMNRWIGSYTPAVRKFAFILRVDGEIHKYTQEWNIEGAQRAKRKKDWVEVEIGIPIGAWKHDLGRTYKQYLVSEIEKGLHSMIELLRRRGFDIKSEALLADWAKIKLTYISGGVKEPSGIQ